MSVGAGLLCPGQGAQRIGMGYAAYEASAAARSIFAEADAALDFPLSRLCFEGPDVELRQTRWQQPAILVSSLAILAARHERREAFAPSYVTGHSLGLYTALVVAGALNRADAIGLVAKRGELMQRAADEVPGGMAAVLGLDDSIVEEVCSAVSDGDDIVVAANYNAPGQVVISGALGALHRAMEEMKARGARRVVVLPVAGPFHSPLMRHAADALAPALRAVSIGEPACAVIGNNAARLLRAAAEIRDELLGQILAPVRWTMAVRFMADCGVSEFVDCGPSTTLAGLMKRIVPHAAVSKLDEGG